LGILSSSQFGFRRGLSTEIAAARMVSHIHDVIDRGKLALGLALDLSKAFDCLDHDILLSLLDEMNMDDIALNWFRTYLDGRSQITCLGRYLSGTLKMTIGCPQGTVLSPILFIIYINSLFDQCPLLVKFAFADDCTIIFEIDPKNVVEDMSKLNYLLMRISNWFKMFRLAVNAGKSQAVLFRTNHRKIDLNLIQVIFDGNKIDIEQEMTCLGLTLRYNLSWTSHVNKVILKCSTVTGALRHMRTMRVPASCLISIFKQLFMSYMSYMAPIWAECGLVNLHRLQVSQNQALRAISGVSSDVSVGHMYGAIRSLRVNDHLLYFTYLYIFKNFRVTHVKDIQYRYALIPHRAPRNNLILIIPKCRLALTQRDLNYRISVLWNNLEDRLRNLLGIRGFKKLLREKLLAKY
jgi:hypothetical protein